MLYSRDKLIQDIISKHSGPPWTYLNIRPTGKYVSCAHCNHVTVRVTQERYGNGTRDYIYWIADTWVGRCQLKECRHLNLWIELSPAEELDQENRRLLVAACDRELKSL